jgi:hypothetical protein
MSELTIKQLILGEFSNGDIERVFRKLIEANQIPNDLNTAQSLEVYKNLPWYYRHWRNGEAANEMLTDKKDLEQI